MAKGTTVNQIGIHETNANGKQLYLSVKILFDQMRFLTLPDCQVALKPFLVYNVY